MERLKLETIENIIGIEKTTIEVCEKNDEIATLDKCILFGMEELKQYRIAEEQGLLLKKEQAVDEGYLYDWYIHSVIGDEPIWTEAHIEELFNDFILIPKEEAEQSLARMEKENG